MRQETAAGDILAAGIHLALEGVGIHKLYVAHGPSHGLVSGDEKLHPESAGAYKGEAGPEIGIGEEVVADLLFDELAEIPRERLEISICEFCAEAHVDTATYSKAKKKSINPQSLSRLVQELCSETDEAEFMGYGEGALKEVYRAMRFGIEKIDARKSGV